jgi:hypothetical protein
MRDLERLAATTGIGGVVLFIVSIFMVPSPPVADDSTREITGWLADNASTIRAAQYVAGLAIVLFVWFVGTLWSHLRRVEGSGGRLAQIFLVAAVAAIGAFLLQNALLVVATYDTTGGAATTSAALFRLSLEIGPHTSFLIGPMVAALGLAILRHGALPRLLGWYCAAFALYELVEGACVLNRGGALSPGGAFNVVGPVLFAVWGVWVSGALLRRIGRPLAPAPVST